MRNAMFFPNRILYREELLSTTVTYAVDLDEAEFWNLKPVTAITAVTQDQTRHRVYEDEFSQSR